VLGEPLQLHRLGGVDSAEFLHLRKGGAAVAHGEAGAVHELLEIDVGHEVRSSVQECRRSSWRRAGVVRDRTTQRERVEERRGGRAPRRTPGYSSLLLNCTSRLSQKKNLLGWCYWTSLLKRPSNMNMTHF